jgi:ATP-dependent DNA helicase RecG
VCIKIAPDFITQFGAASRKDIDILLMSKLPDILDEKQKFKKINNLLNEMSKKDRSIKNIGNRKNPKWVLT